MITVSNLGKAYKQYPNRWSRLAEWLDPRDKPYHQFHWVLQDINFTVLPGEAVGIIGINGAGKSTLLKMISGTIQPTTGSALLEGRVAALLELGMGFHPDFTGRQNAIMAGQLCGYSVEEIAAIMPVIEDFAEIGDYIDQPLRIYSSGMQVRLAFSVATAIRPDILIVDEALSVGDAYFSHKSFDRIREFQKHGTTLLIVSHSKEAIQSICNRAILLNGGRMTLENKPEVVFDYYNAMLAERENKTVRQVESQDGKVKTISGTGEVTLQSTTLVDEADQPIEVVNVGQAVKLKVATLAKVDVPELVVGYMIKDRLGQPVFGTNTHHLKRPLRAIKAGANHAFVFSFPANLGTGTYSIAVALHTADTHLSCNYEWSDIALVFNVINADKEAFVGAAWLPPRLEISL